MHSFKIQGQIYHAVGSILPSAMENQIFNKYILWEMENSKDGYLYVLIPIEKFYLI